MAQKVTIELVDDLDGNPISDGGGTVTFALGKKSYEIDLSTANKEKLEKALSPFISAARAASSSSTSTRSAGRSSSKGKDLSAVREWARANGHAISDRGRVPSSVIEAYEAAN